MPLYPVTGCCGLHNSLLTSWTELEVASPRMHVPTSSLCSSVHTTDIDRETCMKSQHVVSVYIRLRVRWMEFIIFARRLSFSFLNSSQILSFFAFLVKNELGEMGTYSFVYSVLPEFWYNFLWKGARVTIRWSVVRAGMSKTFEFTGHTTGYSLFFPSLRN